jgi:hypothetical protein
MHKRKQAKAWDKNRIRVQQQNQSGSGSETLDTMLPWVRGRVHVLLHPHPGHRAPSYKLKRRRKKSEEIVVQF